MNKILLALINKMEWPGTQHNQRELEMAYES